MKIKALVDEDTINYKKVSMFIITNTCTFKCDEINNHPCCQNSNLINLPDIEISKEELCERYLNNPITEAIVFGGLEPLDQTVDIVSFVDYLRRKYKCDDDIVIYTGYTEEELNMGFRFNQNDARNVFSNLWDSLKKYPNIIVKFGRYVENLPEKYDWVLGVNLASTNQYARKISEV